VPTEETRWIYSFPTKFPVLAFPSFAVIANALHPVHQFRLFERDMIERIRNGNRVSMLELLYKVKETSVVSKKRDAGKTFGQ